MSDGKLRLADLTALRDKMIVRPTPHGFTVRLVYIRSNQLACPTCGKDDLIILNGNAISGSYTCLYCGTYFNEDGPTGNTMSPEFLADVQAGLAEREIQP